MEIKVRLSNLRTAPRKVRLVADLVRGKRVQEAQSILLFTTNKSARPILKLLNSAIATAKNDLHLDDSNLFISKITVDEGPKLKRWHPMSRGRAYPIIKRSSHVALTLNELNSVAEPARIATQSVAGGEKVEKKTPVKKTVKKETKAKQSIKKQVKKS